MAAIRRGPIKVSSLHSSQQATETNFLIHGEFGLTRRLPSKSRLALGVVTSCVVASSVATWSQSAVALSFGGEQVGSYLGQPLRLAIPLLGATGDSLEVRCFRVVTPSRNDGLAVISQARIELQTSTNPPLLIVRSTRSVDDPVVRVSVEAGCDNPIRRDYTLLLDPPPLQTVETVRPTPALTAPESVGSKVNSNDAPPPLAPSARSSAMAAARAERIERTREARAKATTAKVAARANTDRQSDVAKQAVNVDKSLRVDPKSPTKQQQDLLRVQDGTGAGAASVADASLAALAVPRLKIASDFPSFEPSAPGTSKITDELQAAIAGERRARLLNAPIEEDLSPRLEADLVVAKRRLAELQTQLSAAGIAIKSDSASAAVANNGIGAVSNANPKATPPALSQSDWNWRQWLWIPGVLLVLGLLAFLLKQRRAQQSAPQFATATTAVAHPEDAGFAPTLTEVEETATALREPASAAGQRGLQSPAVVVTPDTEATPNKPTIAPAAPMAANPLLRSPVTSTAEREASDRLNNPLFQLRDTTRHVDVTELSQVTDEAQVYVDLGRSDQAIEILRDHIEQQVGDRDSPAAWLMIFDLYRRTNNRAGYDELAPKFRTHFNGRMPDWDNYGHELALDDGLEAFPHLVAVLQRDWGTPDARKFLEELLYDNRGGSRLGFSLAAYRDILLLLQLHETLDDADTSNNLASIIDWESRGANDDDGTPKWDLSLEMLDPPKVGELESFLRNRPPDDKS